jgi:hypothetical protein
VGETSEHPDTDVADVVVLLEGGEWSAAEKKILRDSQQSMHAR